MGLVPLGLHQLVGVVVVIHLAQLMVVQLGLLVEAAKAVFAAQVVQVQVQVALAAGVVMPVLEAAVVRAVEAVLEPLVQQVVLVMVEPARAPPSV